MDLNEAVQHTEIILQCTINAGPMFQPVLGKVNQFLLRPAYNLSLTHNQQTHCIHQKIETRISVKIKLITNPMCEWRIQSLSQCQVKLHPFIVKMHAKTQFQLYGRMDTNNLMSYTEKTSYCCILQGSRPIGHGDISVTELSKREIIHVFLSSLVSILKVLS